MHRSLTGTTAPCCSHWVKGSGQFLQGWSPPRVGPPPCPYLCFPAFHYESNNDLEKQEFEKALETIAVAFSST